MIGKRIAPMVWVHRDYTEQAGIPDPAVESAAGIASEKFPGHEWEVVRYNTKTGEVALISCPDFETAPEPVVGDSVLVKADGSAKLTPGGRTVYHMKEVMAPPGHFPDEDYLKRRTKVIQRLKSEGKINARTMGHIRQWYDHDIHLVEEELKRMDDKHVARELRAISAELERMSYEWKYEDWEYAVPPVEEYVRKGEAEGYGVEEMANVIAIDYLRKMGTEEKKAVMAWLKKNRPDIERSIRAGYAHHAASRRTAETFIQSDAILDQISFGDLITQVFSNRGKDASWADVKKEWDDLLASRMRDAREMLRNGKDFIMSEIAGD